MWEAELKAKGRDKASLSGVFMKFIRKRLLIASLILVLSMGLLLLSIVSNTTTVHLSLVKCL